MWNVTSSTKPEVHNTLHCRQRMTELWRQATCVENFAKFGLDCWDMRVDRRVEQITHALVVVWTGTCMFSWWHQRRSSLIDSGRCLKSPMGFRQNVSFWCGVSFGTAGPSACVVRYVVVGLLATRHEVRTIYLGLRYRSALCGHPMLALTDSRCSDLAGRVDWKFYENFVGKQCSRPTHTRNTIWWKIVANFELAIELMKSSIATGY